MVKLEDIAAEAGVSCATVSRALAGSSLVNAATAERIRTIAEETGYQVNHVARSLATRATTSFGLVVPEVRNPYYPRLIQLVADRAQDAGYSLQLHLSGAGQEGEAESLRTLAARRADGIVLVTTDPALVAWEEVRRIVRRRIPIVLLGWIEGAEDLDLITGDDFTGGYELTRHLLALGHRRIVLLGAQEYRGERDRVRGFLHAMDEAGLDTTCSVVLGIRSDADLRGALDELLAEPERPTALFAYHDALAATILQHLGERGLSVPEQMAIVGFDNLDLATYVTPPLTTVDHQIEALAEHAIGVLLRRIAEGPAYGPPRHVILPPRLVIRRSCGAGSAREGAPQTAAQ